MNMPKWEQMSYLFSSLLSRAKLNSAFKNVTFAHIQIQNGLMWTWITYPGKYKQSGIIGVFWGGGKGWEDSRQL